jgi:quinol monooxygenase YgiN
MLRLVSELIHFENVRSSGTLSTMVSPSSEESKLMTSGRHYVIVWEFRVRPEARDAFEEIYSPDGYWARLFRESVDYLGTQLSRDLDRPGRYLTCDYWTSREAMHHFKQTHDAEYNAFDQQCEHLTDKEFLVGEFECVGRESVDPS